MKKSFTFDIHGFQVKARLNAEQAKKLAAIIPLTRELDSLRGFSTPDVLYTEEHVLSFVVHCALKDGQTLDEALIEELNYLRRSIASENAKRAEKNGS